MLNRVPEVTFFFWLIKIMGTTVGETAADFLSSTLGLGLTGTSLVMGVLLLGALVLQLRERRYVPWIYWLTVVLISVFGTLVTDNMVDNFGVALQTTTLIFAVALAVTFGAWYAVERTLSIHTIVSTRRELFYWAAILFTFALGTAGGDLMAEGLKLGYATSAAVFAAAIGVVAFAHYVLRANAVGTFWVAYVLTRPFGASCGDLLAKPLSEGGLGLGTVSTSAIFLVAIVALVLHLSARAGSATAAQKL
ncbi:MAG: hypothetical protein KGJ44_08940 [Betaproteobacteria bacterium]|nr:hypothetical protein [Betaproteobacteria bacterium]MDE2048521.1 hypothetical protein [Betaproteobacteria bacterium]